MSRTAAGEWHNLRDQAATRESDASFTLLVERQSRHVFQIAYAVLRNAADAEDLVQDLFVKLFRTGSWKRVQDEKAFLSRMAWRLAISKTSTRSSGLTLESSLIVSAQHSPEKAALTTERSQIIHRLIDALPEKLRRPLALSSIEEMSASEIAAVMDLPEGTVRRLLMEGRALIKEKLARMEGRPHA